MCYDSKRNCLWLAPRKEIFRYDIGSGMVAKVPAAVPRVLGKFALMREQVHVPDADLILLMRLFKNPGGQLANVAFDPRTGRYHFIELPFVSRGKPHTFRRPGANPFSWSSALHYDAAFKVILLHHPPNVWVLRLDRAGAKMSEIRDLLPTPAAKGLGDLRE
jgi:hypothetical protein